jgi:hypothetical protein
LGDAGKVLLGGLVGLAGFLLLRRRKGIAASVVVLSLALGDASLASAAPAHQREAKASTLSQVDVSGDKATIRLQDGTTVVVGLADLEIKDRRHSKKGARQGTGAGQASLAAGQAVVLKVHRGENGAVNRVRVQIFDDMTQARASAASSLK